MKSTFLCGVQLLQTRSALLCKAVPGADAGGGRVCDGSVAVGTNEVLKSAVRFPSALMP